MKIQVLGSGCATCKNLFELTKQAVAESGLNEDVEYLTGEDGLKMIIEMGVMQSPVLAVDGKVVMTGFTPDVEKIKSAITNSEK